MYSCDELFMRSLECYFGVYFPRCCATREINTKITLSWAHKQFTTRVHTLFYINYASMLGLKLNHVSRGVAWVRDTLCEVDYIFEGLKLDHILIYNTSQELCTHMGIFVVWYLLILPSSVRVTSQSLDYPSVGEAILDSMGKITLWVRH